MQEPAQTDLLDPWLGPWLKGFPHSAAPLRRSQVAAKGWNIWRGDLPLPLAAVKVPQLRHNLRWMQDFDHLNRFHGLHRFNGLAGLVSQS
jgi:D-serine dehydratase